MSKKISKDYSAVVLAGVIILCLLLLSCTFIEAIVQNPQAQLEHYLFVGIMVFFCVLFAAGFGYMGWDEYKNNNNNNNN